MAGALVSVVIPTFDRRAVVGAAIDSALAQRWPADGLEVIVVDDGSTDGTAEALARRYGPRLRLLRTANRGVSAARNLGLEAARGEYLALLDSDDEWRPDKVRAQVEFLRARPGFGMVLTDVERMTADRRGYEVFSRRGQLPRDGWVLPHVLRDPALAPASAMFTRAVYRDVGGFDEALRTAEDLDFHLRVARRWPIGVVPRPLTRAMRGHAGLSALPRTDDDYLAVVERFVRRHRAELAPRDAAAALTAARARAARGAWWRGERRRALALAARAAAEARSAEDAGRLLRLAGALGRAAAGRAVRRLAGR